MSRSLKTEAIVLRSIRYGEADSIVHLYTPDHGRINAIAKGVRKTKSRFGGRLEPFFRVQMVLHSGRTDLKTITAVDTIESNRRVREDHRSIDIASRACDAVARIFEFADSHVAVFHLLANKLKLLNSSPETYATRRNALAFRLKLLLAAGFAPQLSSCATCGECEHLIGFSGAAGGVVCVSCEVNSFPLSQESHSFLTSALGLPLAETPQAESSVLNQVERAIGEMFEFHVGIRLRPALNNDYSSTRFRVSSEVHYESV